MNNVKVRLSEARSPGRAFLDLVRANDNSKVYEIYGNMSIAFCHKMGHQLAEFLGVPFVDERGKPVENHDMVVSPLERYGRKRA